MFENRNLQLLSRLRPSRKKSQEKMKQRKIPELDEFLLKRDYAGAMSLLEVGKCLLDSNISNNFSRAPQLVLRQHKAGVLQETRRRSTLCHEKNNNFPTAAEAIFREGSWLRGNQLWWLGDVETNETEVLEMWED